MSWPDGERYLRPLQSLVVSFLLSLVSTVAFSRTRGVLSCLNSSTRRFARFPRKNLRSLVMLAVFSLVFAATNTAFCSVLISPRLAKSRILPAATVALAPGHLSSHSALSSYRLFAPLTLWRLSVSLRPLVQVFGSFPASGAPWSSAMPPFLGRGRENNNNNNIGMLRFSHALLIAIRRKKKFCMKFPTLAVFARFSFMFLADETGPAKESKRTKCIQGWSSQILNLGFGIVFATLRSSCIVF